MVTSLERAFVSDLGCTELEARVLRDRVLSMKPVVGTEEDSEEDLVLRLRESTRFGEFAIRVVGDPELLIPLRRRIAEHAFDLLPLPQHETEVILVGSRAPRGLLVLAAFLQDHGSFTVLHAMHLVYAVFLDRQLVTAVDRRTRTSVFDRLLEDEEIPETIRVLYGALHLSAVREVEAHRTFSRLLRVPGHQRHAVGRLAGLAAADDGGRDGLAELARTEGLISPASCARDTATALATIPQLPPRIAALGRRWRAQS